MCRAPLMCRKSSLLAANLGAILALVLVAFLEVGCGGEGAGCLTPWGETATKTIPLEGDIGSLLVLDRIDVAWNPTNDGLGPRITWTAGEGVLEGLEAEVQDGQLTVSDGNVCGWVRNLDAVPHALLEGVSFRTLLLEGQGRFDMVDTLRGGDLFVEGDEMSAPAHLLFHGDTLRVRMPNGIGHVKVEGRAQRFSSFRSGFGDLDALGLDADRMIVHHAGLGEVYLESPGYLYIAISNAGNVWLHGEPDQQDFELYEGATGALLAWP